MNKNKSYNSDTAIYYIVSTLDVAGVQVDGVDIITTQYSKAGNMTAFEGYSDNVLARAGGGGYCKKSTVLADALSKKYDVEIGGQGQGIDRVIRKAKEKGYTVYNNYAVSSLIYETNRN